MGFVEAIRMALEALRTNKIRSFLTLIGMVIGVFAIIISVTAVEVVDAYFKDSINFFGSSTFSVSRYPSIRVENGRRSDRNRPPITYDQIERLERSLQLPVQFSVLEDFHLGAVRYQEEETEPNVSLLGSDEGFMENYSYELRQGRFITEQDVQYGRPVAVLGPPIADELFPNESPIGKTVRMNGHRYEVIGVFEEKGGFLGANQDNRVVAPITRLFSIYGQPNRNIARLSIRVTRPELMEAAIDETTGRFRAIRKVQPGEENNFDITTNDTFTDFLDAFTGTLTMAGAMIGLISLVAAGIGIMNIMLVSVTERTREIGIRKSIGARRRDIMRQFLLEAFFLCQIGGVLGILLGALAGNSIAFIFDLPPQFPWDWAFIGAGMVTAIALVFGGFPAYKAARLDPIESLRYE